MYCLVKNKITNKYICRLLVMEVLPQIVMLTLIM